MPFKPDFNNAQPLRDHDLWLIVQEGKITLKQSEKSLSIPSYSDVKDFRDQLTHTQYIGLKDGCACFSAEFKPDVRPPAGFESKGLFELFGFFEDDMILVAGCAAQLVRWNRNHEFCGRCGRPMADKSDERAKICHTCDLTFYPRLSPAIIVAVLKDDRILLARSARFPVGFYSVLAGFVEPGETLEACVAREVFEEVGLIVKNIRYFASQPWPFPDSLMLGFTAQYARGEIRANTSEIAEARWYAAGDLPDIPPKISIARQLIDWFIEGATKT